MTGQKTALTSPLCLLLQPGYDIGGYGLITGRPDLTLSNMGYYNLQGNQDYFFLFDSPNKGKEFFIEMGARYDLNEDFHFLGGWDYMKFKREYDLPTTVNGVLYSRLQQ